jgi:recombination protein RecA
MAKKIKDNDAGGIGLNFYDPDFQEDEEVSSGESKKEKTEKEVQKKIEQLVNKFKKNNSEFNLTFASESSYSAMPIVTEFDSFNSASGIGGLPDNGIVEIFGDEGIGKTFIALKTISYAQKTFPNRRCLLIDLEGSSDLQRLKYLGINVDKLQMLHGCEAETIFDFLESAIKEELYSVIVLDSIPALLPKDLYNNEIGQKTFGAIAKLLSEALRKISFQTRIHKVLFILINQTRENIGATQFEPKDITTGGKAIKFYSHMRIKLKKFFDKGGKVKAAITDSDGNMIGHRVSATFIKNRFGPPFKEGVFEVKYQDVNIPIEIVRAAKKAEIVKKTKTGYSYINEEFDISIKAADEASFVHSLILDEKLEIILEEILLKEEEDQEIYLKKDMFNVGDIHAIQDREKARIELLSKKEKVL